MNQAAATLTTRDAPNVTSAATNAVHFLHQQHQEQYDGPMAEFFDAFNESTGRPELYYGYIAGKVGQMQKEQSNGTGGNIAVDFGCGTGWLTPQLPDLGFTQVYGIDTSPEMLRIAFSKTSQDLMSRIMYKTEVPEDIKGKCKLVTAVHVHYHFTPFERLQNKFFGTIASLLSNKGQAIIIGCPSDFLTNTPSHYFNSVHKDNIPKEVLRYASSPDVLADPDGFIPLSCLPPYDMKDGTQMKATFIAHKNGQTIQKSVMDTYWSDNALIKAAEGVGLKLIDRTILSSRGHKNAYMAMHFAKNQAA